MEYYKFNTYDFFRYYFHIPKSVRLRWCIIKEYTYKFGVELRLGIALSDTLYIDVARRRFFYFILCGAIERTIYPARRVNKGNNYHYKALDSGMFVVKPKSYVADIYRSAFYETAKNL